MFVVHFFGRMMLSHVLLKARLQQRVLAPRHVVIERERAWVFIDVATSDSRAHMIDQLFSSGNHVKLFE
jgi:hypothetical protein